MQLKARTAEYYKTLNGIEPTRVFIDELRDVIGKGAILRRISRAEQTGAFGDCHDVGDGVWELRFDIGPGYRVYYSIEHGDTIILLLMAGDKRNQNSDIASAKANRGDWIARNPEANRAAAKPEVRKKQLKGGNKK